MTRLQRAFHACHRLLGVGRPNSSILLFAWFALASGCTLEVPRSAQFPADAGSTVPDQADGLGTGDSSLDDQEGSVDLGVSDLGVSNSEGSRRSPEEAGWVRYHTEVDSCYPRYDGPRAAEFRVTDWPPCEGDLRGQAWCQGGRDGSPSRCNRCEQNLFYCPEDAQALDMADVDATVMDAALPALCNEDERVSGGRCIPCAPGETNAANDSVADGDTQCDAVVCGRDEYVSNHTCAPCGADEVNEPGDLANGPDTQCDTIDPCTAARAILQLNGGGTATVNGFRVDVLSEDGTEYSTCDDNLRLSEEEWMEITRNTEDAVASVLRWSFSINVVGEEASAVFSSNSGVDILYGNGNRANVGGGTFSLVLDPGSHPFAMIYEASRIDFPEAPPTMSVEIRRQD